MYLCLPGRHTLEQLCEVLVGWERHFLFHAGQSSVRAFVRSFVRSLKSGREEKRKEKKQIPTERCVYGVSRVCVCTYVATLINASAVCTFLSRMHMSFVTYGAKGMQTTSIPVRSFLPPSLPTWRFQTSRASSMTGEPKDSRWYSHSYSHQTAPNADARSCSCFFTRNRAYM